MKPSFPLVQLDGGRELAALLIDGTDSGGIRLGDDEHRWSMGRHGVTGNCRQADARHHHGCGFGRRTVRRVTVGGVAGLRHSPRAAVSPARGGRLKAQRPDGPTLGARTTRLLGCVRPPRLRGCRAPA